jgi:hypothetical protein
MVEPANARAFGEQTFERGAIAVERDVEHGDRTARAIAYAREQVDLAFEPCHQLGVDRLGEPQLVQRAEAVCVAVEDVDMAHTLRRCDRNAVSMPHRGSAPGVAGQASACADPGQGGTPAAVSCWVRPEFDTQRRSADGQEDPTSRRPRP